MKRSLRPDQIEPTPVSRRRIGEPEPAPPPPPVIDTRPRCVWPKCPNVLVHEYPLCNAHLTIAAQIARSRGSVAEPQAERTPTDGVVYYLRVGSFLKIGWTSDLDKRMKAYSPDSVLLAVEPGPRSLETRRHKMFATHRTHGREWYAMTAPLMHHIELTVAEHGQPDPVTFAAQPVAIPQPRSRQTIGRPSGFVWKVG